jgi:large subunit ribosomal protein L6
MSRIGKNPVIAPKNVEIGLQNNVFHAKGNKGEMKLPVSPLVSVAIEDNVVTVTPRSMVKRNRMMWGTTRNLISNMVTDVDQGYTRRLEINGVGYRVQIKGDGLQLSLGHSHDITYVIPQGLNVSIEGEKNNIVAIHGIDRARVGQMASEIRRMRPPEPYKGKGVKYLNERIVRKEGKKK